MSGPSWLAVIFASAMVTVAAYCAGRLVMSRFGSRKTHVDIDVAHVLMGVAMAGGLVATLNPIPARVWEGVFVLLAGWFIWRCGTLVLRRRITGSNENHVLRLSHYLTYLVMAFAMLYTYLAAAKNSLTSMGTGLSNVGVSGARADFVGLPLLFLVVLVASSIWELDGTERLSLARSVESSLRSDYVLSGTSGSTMHSGEESTSSIAESWARDDKANQGARWLSPGGKAACHIVMCVTMGYMLILML
jgi:hypothetical protein